MKLRHARALWIALALNPLACGGGEDAPVADDTEGAWCELPGSDTVTIIDTEGPVCELPVPDGAGCADTEPPPPAPIATRTWSAPARWADPIADYLAAGEAHVKSLAFERGIHDLVAYDGLLHLGFGDANLNLGRVFPIDFRAFTVPWSTDVRHGLVSGEEQLDRFRRVGPDLLMAGVDATADEWLGNVYRRAPGANWVLHRTVQNGVHVHDVAAYDGAVFAVGSGGTPEEWNGGDIYGHLWRSTDGLASWTIADRVHNDGGGDARLTRLLPLVDGLFVFGYTSNAEGLIDALPHARWDGHSLAPLGASHGLARVFVTETDAVGPLRGLVRGRDFGVSPAVQRAWWFGRDASVQVIEAFAGLTVVDVDVVEATGEVVALTVDGPDWRPDQIGEKRVRAWVAAWGEDRWREVFDLTTLIAPKSIAYWMDGLYLGTETGQVWRAQPE